MALLEDVKQVLRISTSNTSFDSEITDLIDAAKTDLTLSGLLVIDDTDKLIKRVIILYVKANFGWDNPDADKLNKSYEMLKSHLCLSTDYAYYKATINVGEQKPVVFDDTKKESNSTGEVIFYCRAKNHVKYTVDGIDYYVDITGNCDITVGD